MDRFEVPVADLAHDDHVEVIFEPPFDDEAVGNSHRNGFGMPQVIDLPDDGRARVRLLETSAEHSERKRIEGMGALVFQHTPSDADELEEQLDDLALRIHIEEDDHVIHVRREQLNRQFHEMADRVRLVQRKRTYVLTRARIGSDFHPWTTRDYLVFRIETVRPLPADFKIDPWARKDRARRRDEAIRIFGEAERESREWMS